MISRLVRWVAELSLGGNPGLSGLKVCLKVDFVESSNSCGPWLRMVPEGTCVCDVVVPVCLTVSNHCLGKRHIAVLLSRGQELKEREVVTERVLTWH